MDQFTLDNCKFDNNKPCRRETCPAWFELDDFSGCAFDIAGELMRKAIIDNKPKIAGIMSAFMGLAGFLNGRRK